MGCGASAEQKPTVAAEQGRAPVPVTQGPTEAAATPRPIDDAALQAKHWTFKPWEKMVLGKLLKLIGCRVSVDPGDGDFSCT